MVLEVDQQLFSRVLYVVQWLSDQSKSKQGSELCADTTCQ